MIRLLPYCLSIMLLSACLSSSAQQITGVWNGRIDGRRAELKFIQKGDSITGTVYYYQSPQQYKQYRIRGYFDPLDNSVVWWDDALIIEKGSRLLAGKREALQATADFNCPGGGRMYLNGRAKPKDSDGGDAPVALVKVDAPHFPDVWDDVIAHYTEGMNDPQVIDSITLVAYGPQLPTAAPEPERKPVFIPDAQPAIVQTASAVIPQTIEEKFNTRKKVFTTEIPISGDSLELRFYDNAEVDGDSISLFLNNQTVFEHVRLTEKAYTIKLPTTAFSDTAELVMVAENLGSIPPNTSYMVALCGSERYEARLASTEWSSALIRLRKKHP